VALFTSFSGCDPDTSIPDTDCLSRCDYTNAFESCDHLDCQFRGCFAGFGNCNDDLSDGCEAELTFDAKHCGACATKCGAQSCDNGVCGGAVSLFAAREDPFIEQLVIDESFVYWVSSSAGTASRAPKAGGPVEVLARDQVHALRIAVNGDFVYWLSGTSDPGGEVAMQAILRRMSKSGSAPEQLAQSAISVYRFSSLVVDGGFVHWIGTQPGTPSQVLRIPQTGGPVEMLGNFAVREEPLQFALHGGSVYVLAARATDANRLVHRLERHTFGATGIEVLADAIAAGPTSRLAVTDQGVFFTGEQPATLFRSDLSGQNLKPVAGALTLHDFAVTGNVLYGMNESELLLVDLEAGRAQPVGGLGAAARFEGSIAIDSVSVFFANSLGIWRFSRIK
jgi:hypothetical protein